MIQKLVDGTESGFIGLTLLFNLDSTGAARKSQVALAARPKRNFWSASNRQTRENLFGPLSPPAAHRLGIERDPAKLSCLGCSVTQGQSIQHMAHAATGSGGPDTLKFPGISKMTESEMQSQVDG